jgi:hypothetical protein
MKEKNTNLPRSEAAAILNQAGLRRLVYELAREHRQLRLPLLGVAAAGAALAANPDNPDLRREAREAWQRLNAVVEGHFARADEAELLRGASQLKVLPPDTADALIEVCDKLEERARRIAGVDFDAASPDAAKNAGLAMRDIAVALDEMTAREEREVMPRLRHALYGLSAAANHIKSH